MIEFGKQEGRKWITITIMIMITENFRVYPQSLPPIGYIFCYTAVMNADRTFRKLARQIWGSVPKVIPREAIIGVVK